jgi:hypothetical protein
VLPNWRFWGPKWTRKYQRRPENTLRHRSDHLEMSELYIGPAVDFVFAWRPGDWFGVSWLYRCWYRCCLGGRHIRIDRAVGARLKLARQGKVNDTAYMHLYLSPYIHICIYEHVADLRLTIHFWYVLEMAADPLIAVWDGSHLTADHFTNDSDALNGLRAWGHIATRKYRSRWVQVGIIPFCQLPVCQSLSWELTSLQISQISWIILKYFQYFRKHLLNDLLISLSKSNQIEILGAP